MKALFPIMLSALENLFLFLITGRSPEYYSGLLPFHEFVTLFQGKALITVDGAEPAEIKAGDSFFFPKGCAVRWDIRETVSKYMVVAGTGPVV